MDFMISDDYGLCRLDDEGNQSSFTYGNVWGFNGYAFGAFRGFERASRISEEKAKEYLINEHGLLPEIAEQKVKEASLGREETIAHLKKHTRFSYYSILVMIGFTGDAASKYIRVHNLDQ